MNAAVTDKTKKRHSVIKIILGIGAATIPFIFIFRKAHFHELPAAMSQVAWWTIPFMCVIVLGAMVLQGFRWWLLIRAFTDKLSLAQSMSIHFKSLFYSLVLPNSTVQEVVRSVVAVRHIGSVISWSAAWINKIIGIVVSFGFSVYGFILLSGEGVPRSVVTIVVALFIFMLGAIMASFSKRLTRPFTPILTRIVPRNLIVFFHRLRNGIYQFREKRKELLQAFAVTILVQALFVVGVALIIRGVTGRLFLRECFAFIPLIEMISMAQPFTPNGIGVRDGLVAMMFNHLGLSPEQLVTYVLISNMSIVLRLVGAVPLIPDLVRKRRGTASREAL